MVIGNKTEVSLSELNVVAQNIYKYFKEHAINGTVLYTSYYFDEFMYENRNIFECVDKIIKLKKIFDLNWVRENLFSSINLKDINMFYELLEAKEKTNNKNNLCNLMQKR